MRTLQIRGFELVPKNFRYEENRATRGLTVLYFLEMCPFLSALFIILLGLTTTLFSKKILLSNTRICGFMPNLHKKCWMVCNIYARLRKNPNICKSFYYYLYRCHCFSLWLTFFPKVFGFLSSSSHKLCSVTEVSTAVCCSRSLL